MATTFEVLAEPRRREILDLLRAGERPVGELVAQLTLSQPAVSKHLKVLREAGLVEVRQDAQRRWYRLRLEPLVEIDAWLAPYRRLWTAHLDALERHLDGMADDDAAERRD
jgi:DNA-binding transcriptional ArsR family regulator